MTFPLWNNLMQYGLKSLFAWWLISQLHTAASLAAISV